MTDRLRRRLGVAAVVGVVAALLVPIGPAESLVTRGLAGYVAAGLALALPLVVRIVREDPETTKARMEGGDGDRRWSEVVVIVVGLMSLVAVSTLLVGSHGGEAATTVRALLGVATVSVGWLCVHTLYTLRYARIYYASDSPPIDFNDQADPALSDFAYFSFNLGMTYQVSDTDVRTRDLRKVILAHTVLSYVYGTVVIATTVNLVAGISG